MNAYSLVIALSCVIILSHIFNVISKRTNIPSVILLILLGVLIGVGLTMYSPELDPQSFVQKTVIETIGIVGLIMIVLEGAIDLELTREKWPIIWKSFLIALISLLACAFIISFIINQYYREDPIVSLMYAIPLSIMSSAIVIPSVGRLIQNKKEFMIYESTFSDILGIMFFYFLKDNVGESANTVVYSVIGNIFITIVVSFVVSYGLVMLFQRLKGEIMFFLLIAVLILLYAIGKQLHLSSLVIVLVFGLLINNCDLFFFGKLKDWVDRKAVDDILKNLHLVTRESAFVIRTFFFVMFGLSLDLGGLLNPSLWAIGLLIVAVFFVTRFLILKLFYLKSSIFPEFFITPRGLITVLLFFSIPTELFSESFNPDIILVTIIATSVIMTWGLIRYSKPEPELAIVDGQIEPQMQENGGKEVSYFVERMSPEFEEEESKNSEEHAETSASESEGPEENEVDLEEEKPEETSEETDPEKEV